MDVLIIAGVDITHARLTDLMKLADQAKPFYDWVERIFQEALSDNQTLNEMLLNCDYSSLRKALQACYHAQESRPLLFDGIGRSYSHNKACYYFFSWLIRDAPQQRLNPLIQRVSRNTNQNRIDTEIEVLAHLIIKYRNVVTTFDWNAIREVIVDRLEGSRRSVKGHEKEAIVRTALVNAVQTFFSKNGNYGIFADVLISPRQVQIGVESYDVSVDFLDMKGAEVFRLLVPIKTRETEGGGHAHLFSRDITSAIRAAKLSLNYLYVMPIIVAINWSKRETESLAEIVDHLIVFEQSPDKFADFDSAAQMSLNNFIEQILRGQISPKSL